MPAPFNLSITTSEVELSKSRWKVLAQGEKSLGLSAI